MVGVLSEATAPPPVASAFLNVIQSIGKIDKWSVLAGARFALASIVAIGHLGLTMPLGWLSPIPGFGAFDAVLGFLLISGYSICASYVREPDGFLLRRVYRIYPVYLAAIGIAWVAFMLQDGQGPSVGTLIVNALFLNQVVTTESFVRPAWSLSLEFWLYCLASLLIRMPKPRLRLLMYGSFACYTIYTICRTLLHAPYYSGVGYGTNLLYLSFPWIGGVLLARANPGESRPLKDVGIVFAGHLLLSAAIQLGFRIKHHVAASFISLDALGFLQEGVTLVAIYYVFKTFVLIKRQEVRRSRILRLLGDISYPLYLIHVYIYMILMHFGFKNPLGLYLFAVIAAGLLCWTLDFYSRRRHQKIGVA